MIRPMGLVLAAAFTAAGCHGPQGVRGYVFEADGPDARVCVRDVGIDHVPPPSEGLPVPGAGVRVEVVGKAGGWVPFGPYAEKAGTRTDGLGGFAIEWSEVPHPQDARLVVEKDGFDPVVYRFALPGYQEVRVWLARRPPRAEAR